MSWRLVTFPAIVVVCRRQWYVDVCRAVSGLSSPGSGNRHPLTTLREVRYLRVSRDFTCVVSASTRMVFFYFSN